MLTRISLIIVIFLPLSALAQVEFSEVMYDLETGSDSGREWVEIKNTGAAPVDVSGYRLREATTNHALTISQGNPTLPPGGVAIIADNPAKFLIDVPGFSGVLFDSSFSLGNTGETLILKDSALVDVDQFTYSSDMGANGDGKTLQKIAGSWIAALPTPGSVAADSTPPSSSTESSSSSSGDGSSPSESESSESSDSASSSQSSTGTASGSSSKWPTKPQIYAYAGEDKKVTVGTPEEFLGEALGIDKKPLENARYLWNFGDGASAEGKHVLHAYRYPGSYVAMLDVSSGEFSNSDKLVVTVVTADLVLRSGQDAFGGFLEIENKGGEETELSYWQLISGGKTFVLPKDTLLLSKKSVRFPESVTALSYSSSAELRYPNGTLALQSASENVTSLPKVSAPPPSPSPTVLPSAAKVVREASAPLAELPSTSLAAVAAAPHPVATTTIASSHFGEYKWFYLLGALLGSTLLGIFWLGRIASGEIEIIEDPS